MKKRYYYLFSLMLSSTFVLTSCMPKGVGDNPTTKNSEQSVATQSQPQQSEGQKKYTIKFLSKDSRSTVGTSAYTTGLYKVLDDYEKQHPNVEIIDESLDQSAYQTKIQALAAANDMPDIFDLKGSWVTTFADNGWALDIAAEFNADSKWKNGFGKGTLDSILRGDKVYGVPQQSMITSLVFYNAAMWESIGYKEFPKTWTELLDAVSKFKAKNITPFAIGNKANWPAESCWISTIGDRMTGTDWTRSIINKGDAKFTNPDFINALKTFQDFAKAGALNKDINSIEVEDARKLFYNEKVAAYVDGSWAISTISNQAPENVKKNTKLAILPKIEGGKGDAKNVSGGPAWFFAMGNSVKDPDKRKVVLDIIKAMSDERQAATTASMGGIVAYTNITFDSSKLSPLMVDYNNLMKDKVIVPIYDAAMEAPVIETMNLGLQELLIQAKTPEQLAADIQKEQDKVTKK